MRQLIAYSALSDLCVEIRGAAALCRGCPAASLNRTADVNLPDLKQLVSHLVLHRRKRHRGAELALERLLSCEVCRGLGYTWNKDVHPPEKSVCSARCQQGYNELGIKTMSIHRPEVQDGTDPAPRSTGK